MFSVEVDEYEDAAETVDNNSESTLENAMVKKLDIPENKSEPPQTLNPEQEKLEVDKVVLIYSEHY